MFRWVVSHELVVRQSRCHNHKLLYLLFINKLLLFVLSKFRFLLVLFVLRFALLLFENVLSVVATDLLWVALLLVTLSSELKLFLNTFYLFGKDLLWNVKIVTIFLPGDLLHFVLARNRLHFLHYSLLDALFYKNKNYLV